MPLANKDTFLSALICTEKLGPKLDYISQRKYVINYK